jgi:hypothetical protein
MLNFREFVLLEARPKPPLGWEDEYLNMNSDMAGKIAANKLLQQGMDAQRALRLGNEISDYVWNWSMNPWNVYKRVLFTLHQKGIPDEQAMAQAKKAGEVAKLRYQRGA